MWVGGEHWALHFARSHPELATRLRQLFTQIRMGGKDKRYSVLQRFNSARPLPGCAACRCAWCTTGSPPDLHGRQAQALLHAESHQFVRSFSPEAALLCLIACQGLVCTSHPPRMICKRPRLALQQRSSAGKTGGLRACKGRPASCVCGVTAMPVALVGQVRAQGLGKVRTQLHRPSLPGDPSGGSRQHGPACGERADGAQLQGLRRSSAAAPSCGALARLWGPAPRLARAAPAWTWTTAASGALLLGRACCISSAQINGSTGWVCCCGPPALPQGRGGRCTHACHQGDFCGQSCVSACPAPLSLHHSAAGSPDEDCAE